VDRRNRVLLYNVWTAFLFGVVAIVTAFILPDRDGSVGLEPLIIGIVFIGLGVFGLIALRLRMKKKR
jgi:hypothetical protein